MSKAWGGTLLTNTLMLGLGVVTGIMAARLLLPEGRGLLAAVFFWPQLAAGLGIFSLNEATAYEIGRQPDRWRQLGSAALVIAVPLAATTAALIVLALPYLLGPTRSGAWRLAALYALGFVPLNFLTLLTLATHQGRQRFLQFNLLRMLVPVFYLLGLVLLWATNKATVPNVVAANLVATAGLAVICAPSLAQLLRILPRWSDAKDLLRAMTSFHWATVLMILAAEADRLVAIRLFDDSVIGYYIVAFTLASAGFLAVSSASYSVLMPQLATTPKASQPSELSRGIRMAMFVLVSFGLIIFLLAPTLVDVMFGPAFAPAGTIARYLTIAFLLVALKTVIIRSIRGMGEGRSGAIAEGIALALFLAMAWPLGIRFGPIGLPLALIAANLPALIFLVNYLRRNYELAPLSLWGLRAATLRDIVESVRFERGGVR